MAEFSTHSGALISNAHHTRQTHLGDQPRLTSPAGKSQKSLEVAKPEILVADGEDFLARLIGDEVSRGKWRLCCKLSDAERSNEWQLDSLPETLQLLFASACHF